MDETTSKCTKCVTGLYPIENGECSIALDIPNCLDYNTIDTCTLCDEETILNYDNKSCVPKFIEKTVKMDNCQVSIFKE